MNKSPRIATFRSENPLKPSPIEVSPGIFLPVQPNLGFTDAELRLIKLKLADPTDLGNGTSYKHICHSVEQIIRFAESTEKERLIQLGLNFGRLQELCLPLSRRECWWTNLTAALAINGHAIKVLMYKYMEVFELEIVQPDGTINFGHNNTLWSTLPPGVEWLSMD